MEALRWFIAAFDAAHPVVPAPAAPQPTDRIERRSFGNNIQWGQCAPGMVRTIGVRRLRCGDHRSAHHSAGFHAPGCPSDNLPLSAKQIDDFYAAVE